MAKVSPGVNSSTGIGALTPTYTCTHTHSPTDTSTHTQIHTDAHTNRYLHTSELKQKKNHINIPYIQESHTQANLHTNI